MLIGVLFAFVSIRGAQPRSVSVFTAGTEGFASFRIPAAVGGADGEILAFCEGRRRGPGDSGPIATVLKRSGDGGATWGPLQEIWSDGANTCGNPCVVRDETTRTLWLALTHNAGRDRQADIVFGRSSAGRTVWVCWSHDEGRSWSRPREITASVKRADWGWYATGPGIGIQISRGPHAGRLVIPCNHSNPNPKGHYYGGPYESGAHVIYSDDHGQSWHLGGLVEPGANESQVVELASPLGALMLSSRSLRGQHARLQARSLDGGSSWLASENVPQLVEPGGKGCEGSVLRVHWADASGPGLILFSNPADRRVRRNLTVKRSVDDGRTWSSGTVLHSGEAGYSCLVQSGSHVGCLFEVGGERGIDGINYVEMP